MGICLQTIVVLVLHNLIQKLEMIDFSCHTMNEKWTKSGLIDNNWLRRFCGAFNGQMFKCYGSSVSSIETYTILYCCLIRNSHSNVVYISKRNLLFPSCTCIAHSKRYTVIARKQSINISNCIGQWPNSRWREKLIDAI